MPSSRWPIKKKVNSTSLEVSCLIMLCQMSVIIVVFVCFSFLIIIIGFILYWSIFTCITYLGLCIFMFLWDSSVCE